MHGIHTYNPCNLSWVRPGNDDLQVSSPLIMTVKESVASWIVNVQASWCSACRQPIFVAGDQYEEVPFDCYDVLLAEGNSNKAAFAACQRLASKLLLAFAQEALS